MTLRPIALACTWALCSAVQAAGPRIAVGADFVLVSRTDGTVWAWGQGVDGQLGNGLRTSSSRPVQVPGLSGVVDVKAADSVAAALKADGTVWLWGYGGNGIFGSTQPAGSLRATRPVMVPQLGEIHALALGQGEAAAWAADSHGVVYHWGNNYRGQAGDGSSSGNAELRTLPQAVPGLADVTVLGAADDGFMAASFGGAVRAWGANEAGALGVAARSSRGGPPLAVQTVAGITDVLGLVAMTVNDNAWFATRRDGSVAGWGSNRALQASCGQLGSSTPVITAPRDVSGLAGVLAQAAGSSHALFVDGQGRVLGCGDNTSGQLGDGSTAGTDATRPGPVRTDLSAPAVAVAAGRNTSAAVALDGSVWVWGLLAQGAAGDGAAITGGGIASRPQPVVGADGVGRFSAGSGTDVPLLVTGTQTGSLSRVTLDLGFSPLPADVGREARIVLGAQLPDGSLYLYSPAAGWQPWNGGALPVFTRAVLSRHAAFRLYDAADLRGTAGLRLLLGYGVGGSDEAAAADLLARGLYGVALMLVD